jgi:hypothetical protein
MLCKRNSCMTVAPSLLLPCGASAMRHQARRPNAPMRRQRPDSAAYAEILAEVPHGPVTSRAFGGVRWLNHKMISHVDGVVGPFAIPRNLYLKHVGVGIHATRLKSEAIPNSFLP